MIFCFFRKNSFKIFELWLIDLLLSLRLIKTGSIGIFKSVFVESGGPLEMEKFQKPWNSYLLILRLVSDFNFICYSCCYVFLFSNKRFLFQGSRIHATVKKNLIGKFDDITQVGDLCRVYQFSVVDRPKCFAVADHSYKIMFQSNTYIGPTDCPRFSKSIFNFKSFSEIKDGSQKPDDPLFGNFFALNSLLFFSTIICFNVFFSKSFFFQCYKISLEMS